MEDAQKKVNEYLLHEEFSKLQFPNGDTPALILDFVDFITGTKGLYQKALTQNLSYLSGGPKGSTKKQQADLNQSELVSVGNFQGVGLSRYDSVTALTSSGLDDDTAS